MVKTIEELKALIIWAKSQKVKHLKLADIEITLSDYALIEDLAGLTSQTLSTQLTDTKQEDAPANPDSAPTDDPDLFFSVNG